MEKSFGIKTKEFLDYFRNLDMLDIHLDYISGSIVSAKSGIKIKKQNKGKFTDYCGGDVTEACIQKGKNSPDPKIRKRATFASNARKWNKD